MSKLAFSNKKNLFFRTLKAKVDSYFEENQLQPTGNSKLLMKSLVQVGSAIGLYLSILLFSPGMLVSVILYALLGLNLAMLGFNVMHEGAHNSFSKYGWLNKVSGYVLNALGGNVYFWKIKHNINHHTYTNIQDHDSDIDLEPFMRLHEGQKHYALHRFQHWYWIFLYSLTYISWIFVEDFQRYFTGKIAHGQSPKLPLKEHIIFWVTKVVYVCVFIMLPVLVLGFAKAMIGFAAMAVACGIFISIVFQLAHTVEDTSYPEPNAETNRIEQEWAVHQLSTTANFATKNRMISWLLGGLNFQVEHHLFPRISHVHYPKINQIVKETCDEFDVVYLEYKTMFRAVRSHVAHIRRLGVA